MTNIVFIGESWGDDEARFQTPFIGTPGQELSRMLAQAGYGNEALPYNFTSSTRMINYWQKTGLTLLNVFNEKAPKNNAELFYAKIQDKTPINRKLPRRKFGTSNHYLREEYAHHIETLHKELERLKPNVIVALGNTALWALGLEPAISKLRGNVIDSKFGKVIPTHHPAAVVRAWSNRTIAVLDLHKALRESKSPDIVSPERIIWTEPTLEDCYKWWDDYGKDAELLAIDIETLKKIQVAEIGIASSATMALHIPFAYKENNQYVSWWKTAAEEVEAWDFVEMVCRSSVPKIGQNVLQYDAFFMAKALGIPILNIAEDTMTLCHCWQPELQKSLGFLGSLFLTEREWKSIRTHTDKGDDA
jgi:uracil-DNA glycosylase